MGPPGDPVPLTESSAYSRSPQFWLKALWNLVSPLSTTECKLVTCLHTGRLLRRLFWDNSAIFFTWMTPTQQAVKCSYRVGQKRKTCWFLNKTLWLCEATSQSHGRKEGGNKTYRSLMWILLSPPTPKYKSSSREISSGGSRLWPILIQSILTINVEFKIVLLYLFCLCTVTLVFQDSFPPPPQIGIF